MASFISIYRAVMRYSTLILMLITVVAGTYVWMTWPRIYYQAYCEDPPGIKFDHRFDHAYDCDSAVIEYMQEGAGQCLKVGCRLVEE